MLTQARHALAQVVPGPLCRKVTPTISVDDPLLMLGMPKGLTAATGMDALTHAIEAYVSTASTPVTDACALHAMRLVSSYLRTAVNHGDNIEARDMMRYPPDHVTIILSSPKRFNPCVHEANVG